MQFVTIHTINSVNLTTETEKSSNKEELNKMAIEKHDNNFPRDAV